MIELNFSCWRERIRHIFPFLSCCNMLVKLTKCCLDMKDEEYVNEVQVCWGKGALQTCKRERKRVQCLEPEEMKNGSSETVTETHLYVNFLFLHFVVTIYLNMLKWIFYSIRICSWAQVASHTLPITSYLRVSWRLRQNWSISGYNHKWLRHYYLFI